MVVTAFPVFFEVASCSAFFCSKESWNNGLLQVEHRCQGQRLDTPRVFSPWGPGDQDLGWLHGSKGSWSNASATGNKINAAVCWLTCGISLIFFVGLSIHVPVFFLLGDFKHVCWHPFVVSSWIFTRPRAVFAMHRFCWEKYRVTLRARPWSSAFLVGTVSIISIDCDHEQKLPGIFRKHGVSSKSLRYKGGRRQSLDMHCK